MSNPITSLVQVSAVKAGKAAEIALKVVEEKRKRMREKYIHDVMKWRVVKLGWFKKRLVTREEAEKIVDTEVTENHWRTFPWENEATRLELWANRILASIRVSNDADLWLSLDDADVVDFHLGGQKK